MQSHARQRLARLQKLNTYLPTTHVSKESEFATGKTRTKRRIQVAHERSDAVTRAQYVDAFGRQAVTLVHGLVFRGARDTSGNVCSPECRARACCGLSARRRAQLRPQCHPCRECALQCTAACNSFSPFGSS